MHARFSVRNDGAGALTKVAVQVSSSLQWDSFGFANGAKAAFVQHLIDTDADHTGQAREAVVTLAEPLQPGSVVELSAFYSGELALAAGRLERIGAPALQALAADWDGVMPEGTALRGYGDVLWYPVAGAPVFLGEGAALFKAVGKTKLRQSAATIHLRLTVEYVGDAPKAAYFCGVSRPMMALSENENALSAEAPGVASVEFPVRTLGFRVPSLFVEDGAKMAPAPALPGAISVVTERDNALALYAAAAGQVQPLLQEWLGDTPLTALNVLDHAGQPFEDGALLVTPMGGTDTAEIATVLAHSLTHAWFGSSHVWLNEGLAQFISYLWMERTQGREFALQQIDAQVKVLAFAEPAAGASAGADAGQSSAGQSLTGQSSAGQSLIGASDEVYYRTKAAAVLWMLRSIAGDAALKDALRVYRRDAKKDEDPHEFQRVLEKTSRKDLGWFFEDWVYRDKGLPDLSIVNVSPRELTVKDGRGGWLVAVEVHNSGDAAVEVPVTVRAGGLSGSLTTTERIRVLGGASSSTRILFEGTPEEVVVNDGSVPEVGGSLHVRQLRVGKQ
jgi:hypothetical protein